MRTGRLSRRAFWVDDLDDELDDELEDEDSVEVDTNEDEEPLEELFEDLFDPDPVELLELVAVSLLRSFLASL